MSSIRERCPYVYGFFKEKFVNYEAAIFLGLYFILNMTLSIYNKAVFQFVHFDFPLLTATIHLLFTFSGILFLQKSGLLPTPPVLKWDAVYIRQLWFNVVFTVNIWLATLSVQVASLPLNQILRSIVPIITISINYMAFSESISKKLLLPIAFVVFGCVLTVSGDLSTDVIGLVIVGASCIISSLKGILTQRVQQDDIKLGAADVLRYMCPPAIFQLVVFAIMMGEVTEFYMKFDQYNNIGTAVVLCGAGVLAFLMNIVSFRTAHLSNPLALNIVNNVKQVVVALIAIPIFGSEPTSLLISGVIVACIGSYWYAAAKRSENAAKVEQLPTVLQDEESSAMLSRIYATADGNLGERSITKGDSFILTDDGMRLYEADLNEIEAR